MKPKTLKNIVTSLTVFVCTAIILIVVISIWKYSKLWDYNTNYKSLVKHTITEMVKEDCLRNPEKK
jgi:hypothetical protein